jgi:hypothetical protein
MQPPCSQVIFREFSLRRQSDGSFEPTVVETRTLFCSTSPPTGIVASLWEQILKAEKEKSVWANSRGYPHEFTIIEIKKNATSEAAKKLLDREP